MFFRGSRYRNLPETVTLNADGEWGRGKNLRLAPPLAGRITHTVFKGDRLDLLGFKYYGDTTKWWQIADANPQCAFPVSLLDRAPLVEELFALTHDGFATRYAALLRALPAIGTVAKDLVNFFDSDATREQNFTEATVTITYAPAPNKRHQILTELQNRQFRQLRSDAWRDGANVAVAFTFDDPAAKQSWQSLVETLARTPGVVEVFSEVVEGTLLINYNGAVVARESLRGMMEAAGFAVDSVVVSRVGDRIAIPPNQIV
jgi:hypothetical protein